MSKARDIASAPIAPSTVSATELGYVDGVTSAIQTQIDSKIGSASAINPTIVDAKGDIIAATAADTVARLAVGANGTVLTAASGQATGLQWATPSSGGMTLLSTTTLSGSSTTVSSIDQTYTNLLVIVRGAVWGTGGSYLEILPNGNAGLNYGVCFTNNNGSATNFIISGTGIGGKVITLNTGGLNFMSCLFTDYANTSYYKSFTFSGSAKKSPSGDFGFDGGGGVRTTGGIDSITVENQDAYTFSAGQILIYGIK